MPTTTPKPGVTPTKRGTPLPHLLSLVEACEVLGCSPKTLQRRIKDGELPVIRDGRLVRVHPHDLERFIAGRRGL